MFGFGFGFYKSIYLVIYKVRIILYQKLFFLLFLFLLLLSNFPSFSFLFHWTRIHRKKEKQNGENKQKRFNSQICWKLTHENGKDREGEKTEKGLPKQKETKQEEKRITKR